MRYSRSHRYQMELRWLFGPWSIIIWTMILISAACFGVRKKLLTKPDYLGGLPEIKFFYKVNVICLAICVAVLILGCVLFYIFCVGKDNSFGKMCSFIVSVTICMFSAVVFLVSVVNIHSDLQGTTMARPATYILCIKGSNYYLGFEDQQESIIIPIDKDTYNALGKGHEIENNTALYDIIVANYYAQVCEYDSAVRIDYYFNCAMLEKAELLY